jgi:ferredoxin-NADP reductase
VLHLLATHDSRQIIVLYEPDKRHILYAGDFDPLARAGQIVHVSGAIETLIEKNRGAIKRSILMAAGFDPFLERVRESLTSAGADVSALISETFGPQP